MHYISRHRLNKETRSTIFGIIRSQSGVVICHVTSVIITKALTLSLAFRHHQSKLCFCTAHLNQRTFTSRTHQLTD